MNLNDYICTRPFEYTEIHHNRQTLCCPEWMDVNIRETKDYATNWNNKTATDARESILDGSFSKCSVKKCPHLSTLVATGKARENSPIVRKDSIDLSKYKVTSPGPEDIKFVFDAACNLACPSCRNDFIKNEDHIYGYSAHQIEKIEQAYSKTLKTISLSGAGDPFYSKALFEFMCNITDEEFPVLEHIHLHTNGQLWNERNWNKLSHLHSKIKSAEISIDAATPESYKVVRKGGNWELLQRNLEFISNLDSVRNLSFSFVVQDYNFHEMVDFHDMIMSIFNKRANEGVDRLLISYYRLLDWGHLPNQKYKDMAIVEKNHPKYGELKEEVKKLDKLESPFIVHNLSF
jgi:organic radical activating enzyme